MAITEKIELLGKGLYENIPDVLTLKQLPTTSELDYVGSEDFDSTMLEKILPQAVEENIHFDDLLEIDFQWILRCLRILNYGPYHTTNAIFCDECRKTSYGEYTVNLNTIQCKPLPKGFTNDVVIKKEEFLDFDGDVHLHLPTVRQMLNARKDKAFQNSAGDSNMELARICYMLKSVKGKKNMNPVEFKILITSEFSAADYIILKERVGDLTDYGLRVGGTAQCPNCGSKDAAFIALVNDRFFRPTLGDLREWKNSRNSGEGEDVSGSKTTAV